MDGSSICMYTGRDAVPRAPSAAAAPKGRLAVASAVRADAPPKAVSRGVARAASAPRRIVRSSAFSSSRLVYTSAWRSVQSQPARVAPHSLQRLSLPCPVCVSAAARTCLHILRNGRVVRGRGPGLKVPDDCLRVGLGLEARADVSPCPLDTSGKAAAPSARLVTIAAEPPSAVVVVAPGAGARRVCGVSLVATARQTTGLTPRAVEPSSLRASTRQSNAPRAAPRSSVARRRQALRSIGRHAFRTQRHAHASLDSRPRKRLATSVWKTTQRAGGGLQIRANVRANCRRLLLPPPCAREQLS